MNFLKKGPELKISKRISDVKVPGVVSDVYWELRERHLLPLVIVLVVAIVAVPIALSESPESTEAPAATAEAGANASASSPIVVAKSTPGLRDYRRRLSDLRSKDPFKERFTAAEEAGVTSEEAPSGEESEVTESEGTPTTEETTVHHELKFFSWVIDVRVVPVSSNGKPSKEKPTVRHNLPPLTMLPGRDTPAVVYIGPTSDGKKALMLVSSSVQGVFGDATCALGGETCEMVALEKGVPETFVYGGNQRIFRLELQKLELVATDKVNEAPLGKPKNSSSTVGIAPAAVR